MKHFIAVTILAVLLGACQTSGLSGGTKSTVGTLGGAVLGGFLGSHVGGGSGRLWATGAGAVLGAVMGNSVGSSLDKADQLYQNQSESNCQTINDGSSQRVACLGPDGQWHLQ